MLERIFFSIKMGWFYRKRLREFQRNKGLQAKTIFDLDLPSLKDQGIKVLALDMDGVLVSYGQNILAKKTVDWLNHCIELLAATYIFIYSNRPCPIRRQYFSEHFPSLGFVEATRKKPYPDGLYNIMEKTGTMASDILVVDDRLLTGILASLIAGTKAQWITKPMISLRKRPLTELFFIALRALERLLLR